MPGRRARGEGSIRKRQDGRWEGRYTAGRDDATGKLIYKSVLAKTQTECKRKLREILENQLQALTMNFAEQIRDTPVEPQQQSRTSSTVGEWLDTWFSLYIKPNVRKSTEVQYRYFIKGILEPRIGETNLPDLTGLRLQKLYQELRKNGKIRPQGNTDPGLSPKTIRGIHTMLHNALGQAVKEGLILKNPTEHCRPPRVDRKEMKVIKPEQVGSYLQAAAARNVLPMFFLELTSGLRKGELLALLWGDLDIEKHSISVTKSVSRRDGVLEVSPPKTRHSIRNIIIPQQAVDLLIQEHSLHPSNSYMFPSPVTGEMYCPDTINHLHKKLLKDAGLED